MEHPWRERASLVARTDTVLSPYSQICKAGAGVTCLGRSGAGASAYLTMRLSIDLAPTPAGTGTTEPA
jgi:hypothetical protein